MGDTETWETITEYPNYQVSNLGRVRRAVTNKYHPKVRVLKSANDSDGYQIVTLYADGKQMTKKVHQLVATAFIGPCPDGHEVNHEDGIKTHNHVGNLSYLTGLENKRHAVKHGLTAKGDRNAMRKYPERSRIGEYARSHPGHSQGVKNPKAKLTEQDVREIRSLSEQGVQSLTLARRFSVTTTTIRDVKFRRQWQHVT